MKIAILFKLSLFIFSIVFLTSTTSCRKKAPADLPSFNVLLLDSITIISSQNIPSGKPIVLTYFSPDCKLCQEETRDIVKNITALKDVQLYFISPMSFNDVKLFRDYFKLANYKNVTIGLDYQLLFYKHFKPTSTPYQAVYDRSKKLVREFSGGVKIETLLKTVKKS